MVQEKNRQAGLPKAWVVKKQEISDDLLLLWLRPEVPFAFKPGQYVTIGKDGIERPYSIASAPYEHLIELFVEYVLPENGGTLTPVLWSTPVGDHVSMRPRAKGLFTFQPEYHNHVMVATVTGIAPFVSMVRQHLKGCPEGQRFFIMEGASHQDEFGYDTEIQRLAEWYPERFTFVPTVSRPAEKRNHGWTGATGRVNTLVEAYLEKWDLPKEDTMVYLCGNPGMIEDVKQRLAPKGWPIIEERFWKLEDD